MKTLNKILSSALVICAAALLTVSCKPDVDTAAKAVLATSTELTFAAQGAAAQTITVYSDGDWHSEVPGWITVDPATGNGTVEVTIKAADNFTGTEMNEPRKDTLVFCGNTILSRYYIIVSQAGDTYKNAAKVDPSGLAALDDETPVVISNAVVAVITGKGAVITDGKAFAYAEGITDKKVGDKLTIKGTKVTENGIPYIKNVDEATVEGTATMSFPEPKDITETIASETFEAMEYVLVKGIFKAAASGSTVTVTDKNGNETAAFIVDPVKEFDAEALNGHKVDVYGFSYGHNGAAAVNILVKEIVDNGEFVQTTMLAKWLFSADAMNDPATGYVNDFGGTAGVTSKAEGFGDMFVKSNVVPGGKISYYQVDKTAYTPSSGNPKRIVGATGHPYVSGAWPGDYWLFQGTDGKSTYPAGTKVHIYFQTRSSAGGHKYWTAEYWDGKEWKPAFEMKTAKPSETEIHYNVEDFCDGSQNREIDATWTLVAATSNIEFRYTCAGNWTGKDKVLANPDGGTNRIACGSDIAATSPYIEVIGEVTPGPGTDPEIKPDKPLKAEWLFSAATAQNTAGAAAPAYAYYTTFGNIFNGTVANTSAGEVGYINANVAGEGKISWNHPGDMATIDKDGKCALGVGSTGHPYITGAWPGDFWMFTATDGYTYPKGTKLHIHFESRISATGQEYWTIEYWDGEAWKPAAEMKTKTIDGAEIKYNLMPETSTPNSVIDVTWALAAPCKVMQFRYTCAGNSSKGAALAAPNGGTSRIAGAEGTSPIFEVVE